MKWIVWNVGECEGMGGLTNKALVGCLSRNVKSEAYTKKSQKGNRETSDLLYWKLNSPNHNSEIRRALLSYLVVIYHVIYEVQGENGISKWYNLKTPVR